MPLSFTHKIRRFRFRFMLDERQKPVVTSMKINGYEGVLIPGSEWVDFEFQFKHVVFVSIGKILIPTRPTDKRLKITLPEKIFQQKLDVIFYGAHEELSYTIRSIQTEDQLQAITSKKKTSTLKSREIFILSAPDSFELRELLDAKNIFYNYAQ